MVVVVMQYVKYEMGTWVVSVTNGSEGMENLALDMDQKTVTNCITLVLGVMELTQYIHQVHLDSKLIVTCRTEAGR